MEATTYKNQFEVTVRVREVTWCFHCALVIIILLNHFYFFPSLIFYKIFREQLDMYFMLSKLRLYLRGRSLNKFISWIRNHRNILIDPGLWFCKRSPIYWSSIRRLALPGGPWKVVVSFVLLACLIRRMYVVFVSCLPLIKSGNHLRKLDRTGKTTKK